MGEFSAMPQSAAADNTSPHERQNAGLRGDPNRRLPGTPSYTPSTATAPVAGDPVPHPINRNSGGCWGPRRAMAMTLRGSFRLQSLLIHCKFPASSGLPQCSCGFYAVENIHCYFH